MGDKQVGCRAADHRATLLPTDSHRKAGAALKRLGIPHAHCCIDAKRTVNAVDHYRRTEKMKGCFFCRIMLLLVLAGF